MLLGINLALLTGPAEKMLWYVKDNSINLTVTSPPYDNVRDYEGHNFGLKTFEEIAQELYRVTKTGGVVVWVVADQTINGSETGTSFRQALQFMGLGFSLHDTMIYRRSNPPLTHKRYEQGFEYMFVLVKGKKGPRTFNGIRVPKLYPEKKVRTKRWHRWQDGSFKVSDKIRVDRNDKLIDNVWHYANGRYDEDPIAHKHPAIFPEKLVRDHIRSWSNPGDTVLDPFCGSGTTAKAALTLGRKFIGIDISSEYVALTQERLKIVEQAV
jgi:DNA modification methylase